MKTRYNISVLLIPVVLLFVMAGCSFLEIDTENKIATSAVDYSKTSEMYQLVIGAYSKLRWPGMHWVDNLMWTGRDDDMTSGRDNDQQDLLRFGYRGGYQCPNSYWGVNNAWINAYEIIRGCNSTLEALDKYAEYIETGSADYAKYLSYRGEVVTISMWAYYMMSTSFGACVLLTDNNQTRFVRSTREHVCEYALEQLEAVIPDMLRMRPNQMEHPGAFTAFSAEALAARFALLLEDYPKVETLTQDIIDNGGFELYSDYYNLFKIPGKLCNESLMEVQVTDFGLPTGDYIGIDQWFVSMGATLSGTVAGEPVSISGWNFMQYNTMFVNWCKSRGETIRLETSCLEGGSTTREGFLVESSGIFNGKAYLPYDQMTAGNTEWGRNNNVRLLRYAEVLLMNAEAKVRNGKSGDAPFNEVRTRAAMPTLSGVTVEQILDERRMELCSEWGLRYTDLVRTGLAAEVLNQPSLVRDQAAGEWTPEKAYWPVPGLQLVNLPDLGKDPE
jgi:SusD family.